MFFHKILPIILYTSSFLHADLNTDVAALTEGHTEFAFSLYPTLDTGDTNLVFSPYSISTCLSMVYLGARGETQSQMQSALQMKVDRKNLPKTAFALNQSLLPQKNSEKSYKLNMANAVWVDQGTFLLTDFRYSIEQQFKAKLGTLNFDAAPEKALESINEWVYKQTQGKIPRLLNGDDINKMTRLMLTNAVFFQGNWVSPFDPKETYEAPFYSKLEESVPTMMMHKTHSVPYFENELLQAVALPFTGMSNEGGQLAFFALLPKSADNFSAMVSEIDGSFDEWVSSLSQAHVELTLPKFTFSSRFDLNKPLQDLGIEDAFDSNANFTGIDGIRDLFLNKVVSLTYFALDEIGVTAAAATSAGMNVTFVPEKPPIPFDADHPFLFFILDLKSKEVLFMGKVVQPEENK
jgi:serpin B